MNRFGANRKNHIFAVRKNVDIGLIKG